MRELDFAREEAVGAVVAAVVRDVLGSALELTAARALTFFSASVSAVTVDAAFVTVRGRPLVGLAAISDLAAVASGAGFV
ncbi:hypothetical protein L9G15_23270, partial [Shewanella sp. A3A]|nr:hypothetical protein [Shewanella ferrihydritica]